MVEIELLFCSSKCCKKQSCKQLSRSLSAVKLPIWSQKPLSPFTDLRCLHLLSHAYFDCLQTILHFDAAFDRSREQSAFTSWNSQGCICLPYAFSAPIEDVQSYTLVRHLGLWSRPKGNAVLCSKNYCYGQKKVGCSYSLYRMKLSRSGFESLRGTFSSFQRGALLLQGLLPQMLVGFDVVIQIGFHLLKQL